MNDGRSSDKKTGMMIRMITILEDNKSDNL